MFEGQIVIQILTALQAVTTEREVTIRYLFA